ncbi:MAG: response regulator [Anaerolineae bacterium]|nr:response regulator [Anaerolineae bacterium]
MEIQQQAPDGLPYKLQETFTELQETTINYVIPAIFLAGLAFHGLVMVLSSYTWSIVTGLALILTGLVLLYFRDKSFVFSSLLIVLVSIGAVLSTIWFGHIPMAAFLFIIPVGLSTTLFGSVGGLIAAIVCSVLTYYSPAPQSSIGSFQIMTWIALWAVYGIVWLALRPLLIAVEGVWTLYEQSRSVLRQSQEYQIKLRETLDNLREANTQLTRLNQLTNGLRKIAEDERHAKEQFVANVSHELRTPLNMIIGFCEMILKAPQTYGRKIPANLLADLEVVLRNSQHLSSLIDDVLDLSQIEAGQMALSKEPSSIAEIIQAATIAVRPLYESKNLYLNVEVSPDLPEISCDRTRIREVLLNLLSNAGRFTETGGVTVRVFLEQNWIVTSVADTGKGISEENRLKLFRPFQQLDGSIRRKYGGTGLGLSISKNFVELHDGKMWVESVEGQGTTFSFRLPVEPIEMEDHKFTRWINPYTNYKEHERHHSLPQIKVRPRVVVVDPYPGLARIFERHMESSEVARVESLAQGYQEVEQSPASALVVNDLRFPNGMEALKTAGELPHNVPAIFCSIPVYPQESERLGVSGYLVKPILRENLLDAITRVEGPVKTLLIVDDEPDAQQLFRRMLTSTRRGYRVLRASNGVEGLEILRQQPVDLILLDLMMPEMDGYQFLIEKRGHPEWASIPVILISARDPKEQSSASAGLAVMKNGGLSIPQVIACIEALSAILSPLRQVVGSGSVADPPG